MAARVAEIEDFFQKPDGLTRWKTWLRSLLEDMFVIDAATLYCQRTRSGQLCALQQLDGATIKRVIDDWGRTPQPYSDADGVTIFPPAYQQVLKGMPAVNYSARDIIYRPRNVRANRVYGYSPVQQVLMTVNIALRRQLWQLDYFTEGSIPDALIGVPNGWTPDQIKQFQDYWDTEFVGDLAKRRRAKFVPGDTASKVVQTKEPEHKDDFDEWLARIICFAFSVPPQWAVKAMNRATADNQSAQSEEEGLEPTKEWVKDLIDEIISEEFASPDLELHWLDEDEDNPETVLEARVKLGAVTLNEMRDSLGLDPYDNAAADRPMVLTATGYVPIEANAGGERVNAGANAQTAPIVQKYSPDQPRVTAGNSDGGRWTRGGDLAPYNDSRTLSDAPTSIPIVDFSGGFHDEVVNAWMDLFQKNGYPAVKEPAIRLVGGTDVYGRPDILAKLPGYGLCAVEIKTGNDPVFTDNQRIYIPMMQLGFHVYSIDESIRELGLLPGVPFPPLTVFIIWAKPGQEGYKAFKLLPRAPK
jgi:hypothetical protein